MHGLMLFSGSPHQALAMRIGDELGHGLNAVERTRRGNGEVYVRYEESVRGADVFLVQSCPRPTNDHLVELLVMTQAASYASARTVTAVIPWYPYARQDKRDEGEPLSARLVSDLLTVAGVDRLVTVDLHVGQIQGFARIPVDHVSAVPLLAAHLSAAIPREGRPLVVVSPDTGGLSTARNVARLLHASVAMITKERPVQQAARVTGLVGEVRGKTCVIVDDMIDTAGTLCAAGWALREHGASRVWACATHAVLSPPASKRLAESVFERIVVTDTLPVAATDMPSNVEVVSIAGMLAATIRAIVERESVSALVAASSQPGGEHSR